MASHGTVTLWIGAVRAGNHEAAGKTFPIILERFWPRMVGLARKKLQGRPHALGDEEDAALSALDCFYRGALEDKFPNLVNSEDLLLLLLRFTAWKARDHVRRDRRSKRGGSRVHEQLGTEQVEDYRLGPEDEVRLAEFLQYLLDERLPDDDTQLRTIACLKLDELSDQQIARQVGVSLRTVQRRLRLIRDIWQQEIKS